MHDDVSLLGPEQLGHFVPVGDVELPEVERRMRRRSARRSCLSVTR